MRAVNFKLLSYSFLLFLLVSCGDEKKKFRILTSKESGITFRNTLKESEDFNIFNYMYFYNGGGVAVADLNNDGLMDIYFTANQAPNKLYLNEGNLKFRDITDIAGVRGYNGWTTGVTVADVNDDGRLDLYVSYIGDYLIYKGRNQLFINEGNNNDGVPQFRERAMEFGLDLVGFSTQAAFFDYDRDGDLDMFMLNHSLHQQGTFGRSTLRKNEHPLAGDRLLRYDNGHFVDVTQEAGIYNSVLGYGLGVVVSDVNLDGWPDIYVGNDFHENDYLYVNQRNGTFKEELEQCMPHTSRYTMGVDFADFNNDLFPDLIGMDMLPEDQKILKSSAAEDAYDIYNFKLNFGYNHQFARNVLQLNNHDGTFSDVALIGGVSATDWSWSALFADFDLDGYKDILVANGIFRRSNDLDYINFMQTDSVQRQVNDVITDKQLIYIERMPQIKIPNYLFINNGDSTFTNKAREWGMEQPSYSNGAAYADLDNDGDLDIVINNIEDEAFLYENRTIDTRNANRNNTYLQVSLKGRSGNRFGIGAKVILYDSGTCQIQECMPTRGYQSAVDHRLTFGTRNQRTIDSLLVIWSDGSFQRLLNVKTGQPIVVDQQNASGEFDYSAFHSTDALLANVSDKVNIAFKHKENDFVEFNREQLIPHMMSADGPALAIADINGDGMDDVFIGGGKWQAGALYIQHEKAQFKYNMQDVLKNDSTYEDTDALFLDADGDGDKDLFVVSGGNEFSGKSKYRKPRLYLNDGRGNFSTSPGIPDIFLTGSSAAADDIDGDGDIDLFLGARAVPWKYGLPPDSYILINDGNGNFNDATSTVAPALKKFGFVKDATWTDIDNDGDKDLIIAAEWHPITIFINETGKLNLLETTGIGLENTEGWWNTVTAGDMDNDGDMDLIFGNLGLNSKLHTSVEEPVTMYVRDFDKNDSIDQVLTHYSAGEEYPFHTRDEMTKQMPFLKKRYLSYHKFAEATLYDMFEKSVLEETQKFAVRTFETVFVENLGNRKFRVQPLPKAAQWSTVNAVVIEDFNDDGHQDLLLGGNFFPVNIQMGRYDASYGSVLLGDGKGRFTVLPPRGAGISLKGQVRKMEKIEVGGKVYYLAARNNDTVQTITKDNR